MSMILRNVSIVIVICAHVIVARPVRVRQADVSQQALPIYVGWVGEKTDQNERLCERFMACLEFSGQFVPTSEWLSRMPKMRSTLSHLFQEGYMLAVFIGCNNDKLEWRLYDVPDGRMITGRSFPARSHERMWVYSAAEQLWHALTNQPAPFVSHMTYVKKVKRSQAYVYQLCIADFDGQYERVIRTFPRYIMAPQWGWVHGEPVIIYSEFTQHNVRIGYTDTSGNAYVLFDVAGTAVGCVQHNNEMIYCRSGVIWRCYYDTTRHKRVHKPIVREAGPCASPTIDEAGNIFYCYQGMIKYHDCKNGFSRALLYDGYYVAPSYSVQQRSLACAQRINGVMQLCTYSCDTKEKQQLTYDAGDVYDPRWSPCGRYIIYTNSADTCIYLYNVSTHVQYRITSSDDICMSPTWSPSKVYVVESTNMPDMLY